MMSRAHRMRTAAIVAALADDEAARAAAQAVAEAAARAPARPAPDAGAGMSVWTFSGRQEQMMMRVQRQLRR